MTDLRSEQAVTPVEESRAPRRRRRGPGRVVAIAGGAALLAVAAAAAAVAVGVGGRTGTPVVQRTPPATAKVTRTTLIDTKTVDGTLGHGTVATVTGRSQGTITWLPSAGSTITRGRAVYSVDAHRIPLLYGTMPLYRTLQNGMRGRDVKMLERNLAKLGYDGFTVDDEFTWATREALEEWQDALNLEVTGALAPEAVVVHDGALRATEIKAALGDPANGPVLTYTGTTREVSIDLDVADRHRIKKGLRTTVELPDGATVRGTVSSVGKVAKETQVEDGTSTTIEVAVSVSRDKKLGAYDTAPVEVTIISAQRKDVLVVPVGALIALAEGGYGVQVVEGPATRYAAVTTGMFADGQVEITGVDEGTTVVVPS
ncbi:peptidoglycan-binding protein [Sphaerisporangium perillae]|uniref:peptidoglycan-binding protein n=1 Tax=Sphaerisporangium perillae TaxID=2935860 RepID=UPI00200E6336|nr:peptidoglycan-binding protein [Sphaerisporangium perillae]